MARPVPRTLKLLLILLALALFLAASGALARVLSAGSAERAAIGEVVAVQARGDAAGVIRRLDGCARARACRARQRANAGRLRRAGETKIFRLDPSTRLSLGGADGITRVAWGVPGRGRPIVQCVGVRRTGDVVSGFAVSLTSLSRPIGAERDCPG
jgi:hypothetical protein